MPDAPILAINTGSSSLKFGVYLAHGDDEDIQLDGLADGIGRDSSKIQIKDGKGKVLRSESVRFASAAEALARAKEWLEELSPVPPEAVGHRVVHGGPKLVEHQLITPEVLKELRACVHFAPLHIPPALTLIEAAQKMYPGVPQFACFDTVFHAQMPEVASRYALPRPLFDEGLKRYGFHGLSYESILRRLGTELPRHVVIAHLGNGASLAAVQDGRSVDTSMGLTPTGGIPMGTRSGDMDPGVGLYLLRQKHLTADSLESLLNHEAGLKALSGTSSDMRDLQAAAEHADANARQAIEIFCYAIRKTIASYAAGLEGLDMVVFTGGIGEKSALVRAMVCNALHILGVLIDGAANEKNAETISAAQSVVRVRVIPTEEDRQIARHTRALANAQTR
ncbi:MAG: acetate/propionate family kinase [Candidatus Acidiferrales bacterium]